MSDDDMHADGEDPLAAYPLPSIPVNQGPPFIAFAVLLDFAVQKAFQDLTILADLLPKKSDLERKTSIAQFANGTRQLFIRVLAILKWARCGAKVDMCTGIQCFLDQQASMFVDTADRLFQLCNSVLLNARLPAFQVPIAVDVLTLGTYPRLSKAIEQRFVPPEKITPSELQSVTRRLNQIVKRRIISQLAVLPKRMRSFEVSDGMVTFRVAGEFEATLTLLGQLPVTPWTLLNFRILVADPRVTDGAELLNAYQVAFLHQYLQGKLNIAKEPLVELYNLLHSFCLSIQLDLLFCQTHRLLGEYMSSSLAVEEYVKSERLVVTYWREDQARPRREFTRVQDALPKASSSYKMIIYVDQDNPQRGLQVLHMPKSDLLLPSLDGRSRLSFEDLLSDTVLVRIGYRLRHLRELIEDVSDCRCNIQGRFPKLRIALLDDCDSSEIVYTSINLFSGRFVVKLAAIGDSPDRRAFEDLINKGNWDELRNTLVKLRVNLVVSRCVRTMRLFPMSLCTAVPSCVAASFPAITSDKWLAIELKRYECIYLVVDLRQQVESGHVGLHCWIVSSELPLVRLSAVPDGVNVEKFEVNLNNVVPVALSHFSTRETEAAAEMAKRQEEIHFSSYNSRLAGFFALCEQVASFLVLMGEFDHRGIRYCFHSLRECFGSKLEIVGIDYTVIADPTDVQLFKLILDAISRITVRMSYDRHKLHWTFECSFFDSPMHYLEHHVAAQSAVGGNTAVLNYPVVKDNVTKVVDEFFNVLRSFAKLYESFLTLAALLGSTPDPSPINIITYTYHKLTFSYGPSLSYVCSLHWKSGAGFSLSFGVCKGVACKSNPHSLLSYQLHQWLQEKPSLVALVRVLNASAVPLDALVACPSTVVLNAIEHHNTPVALNHVFCLIPLSPFVVRLLYKGRICLEISFVSEDHVTIRDCASTFVHPPSRLTQRYVPVVGLKTFLNMHSTDGKRPAQTEDVPAIGDGHQAAAFPNEPALNSVDSSCPPTCDDAAGTSSDIVTSTPPEDWTPSVVPITVKHTTITSICSPSCAAPKPEWSHLHKFLASVSVLDKFKDQTGVSVVRPGHICFKMQQWELRFFINEHTLSSLGLKLCPDDKEMCSEADVHFLENYFAACVSPLYSYNAVTSFARLISACGCIRRDLLSNLLLLMNFQLNRYPEEGVYWFPEICFLVPPMQLIAPPVCTVSKLSSMLNSLAVVANHNTKKVLVWIKFTRVDNPSQSLAFPLLYDGDTNALQIFRGPTGQSAAPVQGGTLCAVDSCLLRQQQVHQNYGDCSVWTSIRDVMHTNDLLAPVNS
uniref:Mediator of RNA polymerase II transcription subunit 14 n=1 Tax=Trichuris muris TaxID=70415 RepID=A0A5S6R235_TRIMR